MAVVVVIIKNEWSRAQAKRDLGKLGVTDPQQLETAVPPGIVCKLRVVLRRDDNGVERNRLQRFDVLRIEAPESDPYAPEVGSGQQAALITERKYERQSGGQGAFSKEFENQLIEILRETVGASRRTADAVEGGGSAKGE